MLSDRENSYPAIFGKDWKERLVTIIVRGKEFKVPKGVSLLRAFHFISLEYDDFNLNLGKHCWAGSCENCRCSFIDEQLGEVEGLACQMEAEAGLTITAPPRTMKKKE